jgi:hypothetical protein
MAATVVRLMREPVENWAILGDIFLGICQYSRTQFLRRIKMFPIGVKITILLVIPAHLVIVDPLLGRQIFYF